MSSCRLQVEVIKKAYMQGEVEVKDPENDEEGEEEHSASPRNVGHNIYILAHQVDLALMSTRVIYMVCPSILIKFLKMSSI